MQGKMQRVKYYFDNNHLHAVVFAGDGAVLPPNISDRVGNRVIRLKEMTPKECTDLVRDVLGNLKFLQPNLIEKIRRKSSGVESFLENCSRRALPQPKTTLKRLRKNICWR